MHYVCFGQILYSHRPISIQVNNLVSVNLMLKEIVRWTSLLYIREEIIVTSKSRLQGMGCLVAQYGLSLSLFLR